MLSFLLNTFVLIINYSRVRGEVYTYGSSKFGYAGVSRKIYIVKSYLHPRVKIDFRMAIPWFYLPNPDTRGVNRSNLGEMPLPPMPIYDCVTARVFDICVQCIGYIQTPIYILGAQLLS